jgi:hypothetical protein
LSRKVGSAFEPHTRLSQRLQLSSLNGDSGAHRRVVRTVVSLQHLEPGH